MTRTTTRLTRRFRFAKVAAVTLGFGALTAACSSTSANSSGTTTTTSSSSSTGSTAASPTTATPATTAPPSITTTTAALTGSGCYVGAWTSTSLTQEVGAEQVVGGSGFHISISSSELSIDFTGMNPVTVSGGSVSGQGIFIGQEQAGISFTPSGTFSIPTKGTSNVTFEAKLAGQTNYSPPTKADGFPTGGISGTYVCAGSTLSLKVLTARGTTTIAMVRD